MRIFFFFYLQLHTTSVMTSVKLGLKSTNAPRDATPRPIKPDFLGGRSWFGSAGPSDEQGEVRNAKVAPKCPGTLTEACRNVTPISLSDKRIPFSGVESFKVHSPLGCSDKLHAVISIIHLLSVTFSSCRREKWAPRGSDRNDYKILFLKRKVRCLLLCAYMIHISSILLEVGFEFLKAGGNLFLFSSYLTLNHSLLSVPNLDEARIFPQLVTGLLAS